jgi:hypothetical protein
MQGEDIALPPPSGRPLASLLAGHASSIPWNNFPTYVFHEPSWAHPCVTKINQEMKISAVALHPLGVLVEYPERSMGKDYIAHVFDVNPSKSAIESRNTILGGFLYSRGLHGGGGLKKVPIGELIGNLAFGMVDCDEWNFKCERCSILKGYIYTHKTVGNGHKYCAQYDPEILIPLHTFTSRDLLRDQIWMDALSTIMTNLDEACIAVIQNTFAFYNTMRFEGCGFALQEDTKFHQDEWAEADRIALKEECTKRSCGHLGEPRCEGRLWFVVNWYGKPYIQ